MCRLRVFALCRTGLAPHVLREDGAKVHPFEKVSAHVSMRRADHVIRPQIDAASDGNGFLAPADVDTAHNLALPVELALNAVFEFPRQLQVIKDADLSLGRRNFRALVAEWGRIHRFQVHRIVLSRMRSERYPKPCKVFKARTPNRRKEISRGLHG